MIIGSKLPPLKGRTTYFSSGRAAFSFLIGTVCRPRRVYLPTFVCWSLVSAMQRRFPDTELRFYSVDRSLGCNYPESLESDEVLVFIHYFGAINRQALPAGDGTLLEDLSHAYLSEISLRGHHVFGSLRKVLKVGDGGFVQGFHNVIYEPARKMDTWLRYEAVDWRDVREAENMLDREWSISDISSHSLSLILRSNPEIIVNKRQANEKFLAQKLQAGRSLIHFGLNECPMLHARVYESTGERDSLRAHMANRGIFTSIHWPTHQLVLQHADNVDISDTLWLEGHVLCFPVSDDYSLNDMERIVEAELEWQNAG